MKTKVFIDGSAGTTGLRIFERFESRDDVELLKISPELRKDKEERKRLINASDVTFLCLPDEAARESVSLVENEKVRILDTSTAHRTLPDWAYGFPELSEAHREKIRNGNRIAVPGCYATGFISLVYPMIAGAIMEPTVPVTAFGLSGYSGAGKKAIAIYESEDRDSMYDAPREYALNQSHKHLKEMKAITGLSREPLFSPIVCDYYSGMVMSVPLYTEFLNRYKQVDDLRKYFSEYFAGEPFIQVMEKGAEEETLNMLPANQCSGYDGLRIYVTGNEDRIVLSSQFDNLGKGASGAAIQCLNIILGCEETKGLQL